MDQSKWRSPVVWTTLAVTVIGFLVNTLELKFDVELINGMINGVIAILIGFGVLNNPTNKTGF